MKLELILVITLFSLLKCYSQVERTGKLYVSTSGGVGASNLLNSEAPHKTHIFYSDISPIKVTSYDLEKFPYNIGYESSLWDDKIVGATINVQAEYFVKENTSIESGISFEKKGIDLNYFKTEVSRTDYAWHYHEEKFNVVLNNNYLIIPITLKQYLLKNKEFYIGGGIYFGYLLKSKIYYLTESLDSVYYNVGDTTVSSEYLIIDNKLDEDKEYTNKIDFGILFKSGYTKSLTQRLLFKAEFTCNLGLRKVDGKYNNEYSTIIVPASTGSNNYLLRSTNYFNLNSFSKNINVLFTIGIVYKIDTKNWL